MSASMEMPKYKCHKEVYALKVVGFFFDTPRGDKERQVYLEPENLDFARIPVSAAWVEKHKSGDREDGTPFIGIGYYVVYADGYTSWSPVQAFESGYSRIS